MQAVLKNISDDRLRVYIVWLPMLMTDDRMSAERRSGEFADKRLNYFWDASRLTGHLWQGLLDLGTLAWDIYFLYDASARWKEHPPAPSFWMHQLGKHGSDKGAPLLNEGEFESRVKEALGKTQSIHSAESERRRQRLHASR